MPSRHALHVKASFSRARSLPVPCERMSFAYATTSANLAGEVVVVNNLAEISAAFFVVWFDLVGRASTRPASRYPSSRRRR